MIIVSSAMTAYDELALTGVWALADELRTARSTGDLLRRPQGRDLLRMLDSALATVEHHATEAPTPGAQPFYRIAAWNVRRGLDFEGVLHQLRTEVALARADVLLLTETDKGMARSGNRDVALELGRDLGMHVAFVPCYFNLSKGTGAERDAEGENARGLHGNAILSRYPLSQFRVHALPNGKDKLSGPEKRLGQQRGLTACVELPGLPLAVTCVHLDALASRRHRRLQMEKVLAETADLRGPHLIGGDWNTTTHDCQSGTAAVLDFVGSLLTGGIERSLRGHHLHPERDRERPLFEALRRAGYEWKSCNVPAVPTWHFDLTESYDGIDDWLPRWAPATLEWALGAYGGRGGIKIDWLAARGLVGQRPAVLADLRHAGRRVSDHDPILVDVVGD